MRSYYISTPLSEKQAVSFKAGDHIFLSGIIYTARDAAHKRMIRSIEEGKTNLLPFSPKGQVIYYAGPTPPRPGNVIGAVGPTTSYRMDTYTQALLRLGVKGMIGKGERSTEVRNQIVRYKALYLIAPGGCGALLSKCVEESEVIAYEDLGPEAVFRLKIKEFPVIVANDTYGVNLFEIGREKFKR